jgi:hypothetical protein
MSNIPIFKIHKLVGMNMTDTIYVFNDEFKKHSPETLKDLFDDYSNNELFSNTFKPHEIEEIIANKIHVEFIPENIYIDDSIGIIKLKIFKALRREISTDELYLFSFIKDKIDPISSYQILTQNNKLPLTKTRLDQLLFNMYDFNKQLHPFELEEKDEYTYDDILNLNLINKYFYLGQPLGQKFVFSTNYPFISNPFFVEEYDHLLENSRNELSSLNNNLLLDTPNIIDNTLYLCLAEDVFNYNVSNDISTEYSSKIYFPFLQQNAILNLEQLNENKNILINASSLKLNGNATKYLESIDLFHEIYNNRVPNDNFKQNIERTGINFFKIVLYPEHEFVIPIDVIFKIMHSTKNNPLIKFNPSFKQENIYRLYTNEITSNGKKKPYLPKAKIFNLIRKIGKNKSISVYSVIPYNSVNYEMIFEIDNNAHITIYPYDILDIPIYFSMKENIFENIDQIISLTIDPIIQEIKHIFEQSGITLPSFKSIYSNNVEIRELNYTTVYNISKKIDLNKYKKCISSIFNFEKMTNTSYELRYKRVSNFNKYNSQEAFVVEKLSDQTYSFDEIKQELMENFDGLSESDANDVIVKIVQYLELTRGSKRKRNLIIKINPGFPTIFNLNSYDSTLTINVERINNIYYLNCLRIYLDSIIRIAIEDNNIPKQIVNKLCSGKDQINEFKFDDIISKSEDVVSNNRIPELVDETPIYDEYVNYRENRDEDETNLDDIMNLFEKMDDSESDSESDSDSQDDFQYEGGMETNSSEKINIPEMNTNDTINLFKHDLVELIGYSIATSFSKYIFILSKLNDELNVKLSNESDPIKINNIKKITLILNELIKNLEKKYTSYSDKYVERGGEQINTMINKYKKIKLNKLADAEYSYSIKNGNLIFYFDGNIVNNSFKWMNNYKEKINDIMNRTSKNIEYLISSLDDMIENKITKKRIDKTKYLEIFGLDQQQSQSQSASDSYETSTNGQESDEEDLPEQIILKKKDSEIVSQIPKKRKKTVRILKNKKQLLSLIAYNIAKTYSKYINILENVLDTIGPFVEKDKKIKIIDDTIRKKLVKIRESYTNYETKFEELGGNINLLNIDNYDRVVLKNEYTVSNDGNKLQFIKTKMRKGKPVVNTYNSSESNIWMNSFFNSMNKILKNNGDRINKLIEEFESSDSNDIQILLSNNANADENIMYSNGEIIEDADVEFINSDSDGDVEIEFINSDSDEENDDESVEDDGIEFMNSDSDEESNEDVGAEFINSDSNEESKIKVINSDIGENRVIEDADIEFMNSDSDEENDDESVEGDGIEFMNSDSDEESVEESESKSDELESDELESDESKTDELESDEENILEFMDSNSDEESDDDFNFLIDENEIEENEENKDEEIIQSVIEEHQNIVNPMVDVDISKTSSSLPSSSSSSSLSSSSASSGESSESDDDDSKHIIEIIDNAESSDEEDDMPENEELELEPELEEESLPKKIEIDPTGMSLKSPNYFTKRLTNRDKNLFSNTQSDSPLGEFSYSRTCEMTSSVRRQPVILTESEKKEIMKDYGSELNESEDFIEYSSDPTDKSKKFYYMCPRFWCLKTDKMITEKDILDGKCGPKVSRVEDALIPPDSPQVPKNRFVYEFITKTGTKQYPGFHSKMRKIFDKNGKKRDVCLPCCFSKLGTARLRNNVCKNGMNANLDDMSIADRKREDELIDRSVRDKDKDKDKDVERERDVNYIKNGETYGNKLQEYRRGLLPTIVQQFLHEVSNESIDSGNKLIKNKECLLRVGVEYSENKSFLACIANYLFYGERYYSRKNKKMEPLVRKFFPNYNSEVPRIKYMVEVIIHSITLDNYIKYQNGDLINIFYSTDVKIKENKINNYFKSKLYKKIYKNDDLTNKNVISKKNKDFFVKAVQSFENFKKFLRNKNSYIDYTYLWDIVCMPNNNLIKNGINMVILNIPDRDMTTSVELICPTNHYLTHVYDSRKKTMIIIKRGNIFEPAYMFKNTGNILEITKYFSEYDRKLTKTLRSVFSKIIKPMLKDKCVPLNIYPKSKYNFKQPILLDDLIHKLNSKNYRVKRQILNYEGKVIGVIAKELTDYAISGFIPCYPSALTSLTKEDIYPNCSQTNTCGYKFSYMDDMSWVKSYEDTLSFLANYYEVDIYDKNMKVSCESDEMNGFCRVVEDGVISGFLTESNQFIPIKEPVLKQDITEDNVSEINYNSSHTADLETMTATTGDSERAIFVKRVELETNYYNVFRNVIRILLNDYKNIEKRKQILNECNDKFKPYLDKIKNVNVMLRDLTDEYITFLSSEDGYDIENIESDKLQNCVSNDLDKCSIGKHICTVMDDKCGLIIPKNNLVTDKDNEILYFGKISDELIRYNRISSFIFKPNSYLSFMKIKYKINSDEIILLQEMITQEYFEELSSIGINKYLRGKTYDTANPLMSDVVFSNEASLDDVINPAYEKNYEVSNPTKIYNKYPREMFPENYKEIIYSGNNDCGLYLVINLFEKINGSSISIHDLKQLLVAEYIRYTNDTLNTLRMRNLIGALNEEGQIDTNQLQDKTMDFNELIMNQGFIPTNFDLWLLLRALKIPSLFISIKFIAQTRFNKKEFVAYANLKMSAMAVIIIPASFQRKRGVYPIYKLILNDELNERISISVIEQNEQLREALNSQITVESYLDKIFIKDNKTKHKKRKPGKRVFDDLIFKDVIQHDRHGDVSGYNISYDVGERSEKIAELGINELNQTQTQTQTQTQPLQPQIEPQSNDDESVQFFDSNDNVIENIFSSKMVNSKNLSEMNSSSDISTSYPSLKKPLITTKKIINGNKTRKNNKPIKPK